VQPVKKNLAPPLIPPPGGGFTLVVKILATLFLLCACSGPAYKAPVDERAQPPSQKITVHTVARGETLYSIAWRFGLDVNDLARVNGISRPFTIYPGQQLSLDIRQKTVASNPPAREVTRVTNRSRNAPKVAPSNPPVPKKSTGSDWKWPAQGKVIERFGGRTALNKGIDIAAKKGEPVFAAREGTVVYAGNGLRGYGNLLILRHDANLLSAYAHNRRLLVEEGEAVTSGQQIAEIGSSGTDTVKLHFEIRQDGKPVDPLQYLPAR